MSFGDDQEIATADGTTTGSALRQRISVLAPGIVLVREYPRATADTWAFMAEATAEVADQFAVYVIVLDLTEATTRPRERYLETIKRSLRETLRQHHLAVIQPGGALLRSVLRFVISGVAERSSVHASLEEALAAARTALDEARG